MDSSEVVPPKLSNLVLIVTSAVVVSALIAGSAAYAYQKSQSDKLQADLQSQIDSLKNKEVESKMVMATATPSPTPNATVTPTATPAATPSSATYLSSAQLLNFTYKNQNGQYVALKDGTGKFAIVGGPGELTIVQNGPASVQAGDLDGDGSFDSIVYLRENDGGTGVFPLLAAVLNKNGQPVLSDVHTILEDRATVDSISIDKGIITVQGKVRGTNKPVNEYGDTPKTEKYKLFGGKLVVVQ